MLHFFISKALAPALTDQITPVALSVPGEMRWFGHLVPALGSEWNLWMEEKTRYCVLFHDLQPADYRDFRQVFSERLCREVPVICQTQGTATKRLTYAIETLCRQSQISVGLDYAISGEVFNAAIELQQITESLGTYPLVGVSELTLSIKLNQLPRLLPGRTQPALPLDAFRQHWLNPLPAPELG